MADEFPSGQLWVEVTGLSSNQVDYSYNAVNTDGVWSFNSGFPYPSSPHGEQLRNEKVRRLDNVTASVESLALQFKVDVGVATTAEQTYLLAFKEYCIAFNQVNKQPGFPLTIVWPELP
ncbi:MAG: tail fiber assembly protein [Pseudomonas sp.]|nr:tail fiber assembly protein [Pseudomonas sp.]MDO8406707.1 tail fiber assembly protein [Pseudomonas sp.]